MSNLNNSNNQSNSLVSTQIKITWKAFGNKPERNRYIASLAFEAPAVFSNDVNDTLNLICADTNLYQGFFWNLIEKDLPANRTHTALSIGDEVEVNGQVYVVGDFGFIKIEEAEITKIEEIVFSVSKKKAA